MRNHVIRHYEAAAHEKDPVKRKQLLSFVVIGGGPTGVELAGQLADLLHHEMRDLYREIDHREVAITLIDGGDRLLKQLHPELGGEAYKHLVHMGVRVLLNMQVTKCEPHAAHLSSGEHIPGELRIWAAGTKSTLAGVIDGKYLSARGGLQVTETLQLIGHPEVFVIGDNMEIIAPTAQRIPQTAQAATATAKHAARNFIAMLRNEPLKPFTFSSKGDIIPIGDWYGVADIRGFRFHGPIAWIIRRAVFIQSLSSIMNRLKITIDWALHAVLPRDTSEL